MYDEETRVRVVDWRSIQGTDQITTKVVPCWLLVESVKNKITVSGRFTLCKKIKDLQDIPNLSEKIVSCIFYFLHISTYNSCFGLSMFDCLFLYVSNIKQQRRIGHDRRNKLLVLYNVPYSETGT